MAFETGQRVGDYEILRTLGKGGLGQVYEACHVISRRCEALKILLPEERPGAEMGERFLREIQLLGALNHPNIASLHTAFYHNSQLVMVMELVNGRTLREMSAKTRIPVPQVLQYTRQVLAALDYAHSHGVVHRDVKPTNIMITQDGQTKLLDFGIAISDRSAELTAPGFMVGSINYMSPEQIAGDKATTKSDIYSVGVMLYEILTGKLPAQGENNFEIMRAHMNERPIPPSEIDPRLPQSLSAAVLRALEKGPSDRFASAHEFLVELEAVPQVAIDDLLSSPTRTMHVPSSESLHSQPGQPNTPRSPQTPSRSTPSVSSQWSPSQSNPSQSNPSMSNRQGSTQQGSTQQAASFPLDDITKKLAVYIGPIASVVVRKLAPKCGSLDDLYKEASTHISSATDRERFLHSRSK
jgi:serine/threonine-protein kinase